MAGKRDSRYFIGRLKNEHPAIHADLVAGRHTSVRAASIAAGLVKPRSALSELKSAWRKATPAQRRQFISWAKSAVAPSAPVRPSKTAFDINGRLLPWARERILEIKDARNIVRGSVIMDELGFSRRDPSFWNAVWNHTSVRQADLRRAVEKWLADQAKR
jgi:hypothetical protein